MFDVLIREAATRFGLGDKALPVAQMLLAYMTNRDTGGLAGFLEKFKAANLGPIVQSWLGGGPSAQPITNTQLETVLGSSGGLLSQLTSQLGVGREDLYYFGDNYNDLPAFEVVGHPIAVANARPEALAVVESVIPSNTDDGVAVFLEEWLAGVAG